MVDNLKFSDAGGITMNHPTWFTAFTDEEVCEMLDFDSGVLGIEIYNDYSALKNWYVYPKYKAPDEAMQGFSLNMWDRILSTGRKCWGFCVPDHSVEIEFNKRNGNWLGRTILLVPTFTEHDCLKAYREGQFYGCLQDNGLTLTEFKATNSSISVSTNKTAMIKFITDAAPSLTITGESVTYDLPTERDAGDLNYVRVEVEDDSGECLFLQPVIYNAK